MSASSLGYTPGTGASVATDLDGGLHHQKTVVEFLQNGVPTPAGNTSPVPVADDNSGNLLLRILQMLMAPLGYDKTSGRQRGTVIVESGTVGTVSTVSTVSAVAALNNIVAIAGYSAQMQVMDTNRTAWAQCVRARIT